MATIESIIIADQFDEMRLKYLAGEHFSARRIAQELLRKKDKLSSYEQDKVRWQIAMCEKYLSESKEL